jgi:glyoxylase-like metal-dependent hydrolase (beta-lactamase superfamily II)
MRVVDNLFGYLWQGTDNNCNSYLFADTLNESRHVLIDPGHIITPYYREPGLDRLVKEMERDGIEAEAIGLVILTHSHPDHCEAAKVIREKNHALVALHEADEGMYKRIGGRADLYLEEGELALGQENSIRLEVYHSPGHSPGHITIYWPDQKVLIAADVVFYQSTGRVDILGGNAKLLRQSIDRLSDLEIEYLLCGHPYGNPGIIKGTEAIRQNFDFIKRNVLL